MADVEHFGGFVDAVSCEISRIFSQMLFIDGSFHGDPVSQTTQLNIIRAETVHLTLQILVLFH